MPIMNWPKALLPNRVEGEAPSQMADRGDARLTATTWMDRLRDIQAKFAGDPANDAMGMAGPMQAPAALGIGIVKTAGPKALTKVGKWGRGPANEALKYLAKKFPRLTQQVEFLMDDTLGPATSARWSPDNYLPYRAERVLGEGADRTTGKVGKIGLNPMVHKQEQGVDTSVDSIAHEMQHMADNLRAPAAYDEAYNIALADPFGYTKNPYENLANITGGVERARFLKGKGKPAEEALYDLALQMRGRFPESIKDVLAPFLGSTRENPIDMLMAVRRPNRALTHIAEGSVFDKSGNVMERAEQIAKFIKHAQSPDALRKAILARKGR